MKARILLDGYFQELDYSQFIRLNFIEENLIGDTYFIVACLIDKKITESFTFQCEHRIWENFRRECSLNYLLTNQ